MRRSRLEYVSIRPVEGFLVCFHPSGGGLGTKHSFSVVVAREGDEWEFKGATGQYSTKVSRAIRYALSRAGFPRIKRLSGYGERERTITTEALMTKDLRWQATVTCAGRSVGGQLNWWDALEDGDCAAMQSEGQRVLASAVAMDNKKGPYEITFTGSVTDENGVTTNQPTITVKLDAAGHYRYLKRVLKLGHWLVDWAGDDVEHGKEFGWNHLKAKKVKPHAEGKFGPPDYE